MKYIQYRMAPRILWKIWKKWKGISNMCKEMCEPVAPTPRHVVTKMAVSYFHYAWSKLKRLKSISSFNKTNIYIIILNTCTPPPPPQKKMQKQNKTKKNGSKSNKTLKKKLLYYKPEQKNNSKIKKQRQQKRNYRTVSWRTSFHLMDNDDLETNIQTSKKKKIQNNSKEKQNCRGLTEWPRLVIEKTQ